MHVQCANGLYITGHSRNLHIFAEIFSMDKLYLAGKTPLLVGDMLVNFGFLAARNKQKQCMLGSGWEFPPNMAV